MKKIFTLIAMAVMAISANAQTITWAEAASKGSLDGKTFGDENGFKITIIDTDASKLEIDANDSYFGTVDNYTKYQYRLKTGGKSSSKNGITVTIPSKGTLKFCVRTGSNSATDRSVILTQGEKELFNKVILESDAVTTTISDKDAKVYPVMSVDVEAGDVAITYPVNGVNFYCFEFVAGSPSGITSAKTAAEDSTIYNLGGQQVNASYKGVVIKNGKKMVQK